LLPVQFRTSNFGLSSITVWVPGMACSSFAIYGPIVLNRIRDPDRFLFIVIEVCSQCASGL
jgi:hypothetical protein